MKSYHDLLRTVMETGTYRDDRTGPGTYSLFGAQARFSLEPDFPLLTTKKLHLRSIIHELLWFIQGNTNIGYLKENKVRIWDEWADEDGNLGRVYELNGVTGSLPAANVSISSRKSSNRSKRILTVAATWSALGTLGR